uniref:hypothetical protein n=1 Tax=Roseivirga sp. TaxID=1964215 RepID=UPI00404732BC
SKTNIEIKPCRGGLKNRPLGWGFNRLNVFYEGSSHWDFYETTIDVLSLVGSRTYNSNRNSI